jgi:hypothetical protein
MARSRASRRNLRRTRRKLRRPAMPPAHATALSARVRGKRMVTKAITRKHPMPPYWGRERRVTTWSTL